MTPTYIQCISWSRWDLLHAPIRTVSGSHGTYLTFPCDLSYAPVRLSSPPLRPISSSSVTYLLLNLRQTISLAPIRPISGSEKTYHTPLNQSHASMGPISCSHENYLLCSHRIYLSLPQNLSLAPKWSISGSHETNHSLLWVLYNAPMIPISRSNEIVSRSHRSTCLRHRWAP
jgi:hypothetical protein